eukprot:CAMPEP_0177434972 /NCGR_PEP_ID=MMETSP0369-20130122/792_1 /TAXON_ID=447022 ORGANISM="Scrippsiella hangoei-like, Strain SHHI-4" /NCGR_SAMPLE_ID=MMETSP0369 /ASSEMBLY_ACC=CAM_ASM_000364 /LENGTH=341 /DNA_ID=CAMNT_0018906079 /DNA_START=62 /DNA_END=1085 /DNA_ORIENTATION=+
MAFLVALRSVAFLPAFAALSSAGIVLHTHNLGSSTVALTTCSGESYAVGAGQEKTFTLSEPKHFRAKGSDFYSLEIVFVPDDAGVEGKGQLQISFSCSQPPCENESVRGGDGDKTDVAYKPTGANTTNEVDAPEVELEVVHQQDGAAHAYLTITGLLISSKPASDESSKSLRQVDRASPWFKLKVAARGFADAIAFRTTGRQFAAGVAIGCAIDEGLVFASCRVLSDAPRQFFKRVVATHWPSLCLIARDRTCSGGPCGPHYMNSHSVPGQVFICILVSLGLFAKPPLWGGSLLVQWHPPLHCTVKGETCDSARGRIRVGITDLSAKTAWWMGAGPLIILC